ncbi:hypothetical protein EJ02DRAFT_267993 [Clathrospora elynae]|uniref:Uncharacterized protein n=1 Tax=Clathrospora elynae TaxID=706981 RepID=A0A6A5SH59_9PLEO|nr:hypothetical protein EJ02DRAFT_267993 [Clathrospora elynae]
MAEVQSDVPDGPSNGHQSGSGSVRGRRRGGGKMGKRSRDGLDSQLSVASISITGSLANASDAAASSTSRNCDGRVAGNRHSLHGLRPVMIPEPRLPISVLRLTTHDMTSGENMVRRLTTTTRSLWSSWHAQLSPRSSCGRRNLPVQNTTVSLKLLKASCIQGSDWRSPCMASTTLPTGTSWTSLYKHATMLKRWRKRSRCFVSATVLQGTPWCSMTF